MKKEPIEGVSADEMDVKELRVLAVSFDLFTKEEAKKLKKPELLEAIHAHEEKMLNSDRPGLKRAVEVETESISASIGVVPSTHNGKKIISQTEIEHNGKVYIDTLVETGETFRDLK